MTEQQTNESGLSLADLETLLGEGVVTQNANVVSGAVVFAGTRVPLYNLWDYLVAGDSIEVFLDAFPTVPPTLVEKAVALTQERAA